VLSYPAFPRFAERTGKELTRAKNPIGRGIQGTGRTLRAFLPLAPPERSELMRYDGIAGLVKANILCTSPDLINVTSSEGYVVAGKMGVEYLHQSSDSLESQDYFRFNKNQSLSNLVFDFECKLTLGYMEFCTLGFNAMSCEDCVPNNEWILLMFPNFSYNINYYNKDESQIQRHALDQNDNGHLRNFRSHKPDSYRLGRGYYILPMNLYRVSLPIYPKMP
jgi:hypothetical protein